MSLLDEVRSYWDADSAVYDSVPHHHPTSPAEQAAWTAAIASLLPPSPARVLDCGAGTGFVTLIAARLGHQVTALDLSPGMLARLRGKAADSGAHVEVVEGPADSPPPGPFDVVIERHVIWTLADPLGALSAWRAVAPEGRLVLLEGSWGEADPLEGLRRSVRDLLAQLVASTVAGHPASGGDGNAHDTGHPGSDEHDGRRPATALDRGPTPAPAHGGHHAEYPETIRRNLPFAGGTSPDALIELAAEAGWRTPRLVRLRDVEWAESLALPVPEQLVGVAPRFAVVAT
jgi:SAM-dependent methyltransferase